MRRAALLLLLFLLLPTAALAETRVALRVGDHATHGRLVFDWPRQTGYQLEQGEGRIVLRFAAPAAFDLAAARRPVRNLRGVEAVDGAVTIAFVPGARPRVFRLGARVVVDLMDAEATPPQARTPAPPAARAAQPAARPASARGAPPARPVPAPEPVPAAPPPPSAEPTPPQPVFTGVMISAPADVGAALLRRGGSWMLVFDAPLPLDVAALHAGGLPGAEATRGPEAAVLRIPLAALREPRLQRQRQGWRLESAEAPPELQAIRAELDPGPPARLLLRAARPAGSVAVLDPETGGTLLVGTLRDGGEATPFGRRAAAFDVLPTRLGAAILPRADTVTLRPFAGGFAASPGHGATLALGAEPAPAEAAAANLTRLFDLPAEPLPALVQRERNATLAVAGAPPLGRGQPRLRNAEALLALGLGAEAQAMAALAMREDPRAGEDPKAHALHAAAALLAGRVAEAEGLLHPRLPASDERELWRGLLAAARGEGGAERIAAGLPLLRAWPEPLRKRLAPMAAEALAAGGEVAAARRLMAGQEEDPAFALARARLLEEAGETPAAIEAYQAIARGRDRRARAIAMRRAAELRLASGALDTAGAAAAMEAVLAAWRGDAQEREARLRLAELRSAAGDHRGAFEALREAEQAFPEIAASLRPRQAEALLAAIAGEEPIAAVALFDTHAALLPRGAQTDQAIAALADRLVALDLVDRARAVLGQALAQAGEAESRARLGLKLAELALGAEDAAAARSVLAETESAALPPPLRRDRLRVEARALARLGEAEQAAARYREGGPELGAELAELLAARQDWAGAAEAMLGHLAVALPPAPEPLPDATRRLVARAAALLALAGDEVRLAALRAAEGTRMEGGAFADAFGLMTAGRIASIGDLPQLRRELELARALPARLEALRAGAGAAR